MAVTAVQSAMNLEGKSVHPFFSKTPNGQAPDLAQLTHDLSTNDAHDASESVDLTSKSAKGRKKTVAKGDGVKQKKLVTHTKNQASLDRFTRPPIQDNHAISTDGDSICTVDSLDVDPNHERRKRQKTASPEPFFDPMTSTQPHPVSSDWHQQLQVGANGQTDIRFKPEASMTTDVLMADVSQGLLPSLAGHSVPSTAPSTPPLAACPGPLGAPSGILLGDTKEITPKKQIKITKSGKLVSSPPKPIAEPTSPKKRRGRKPNKAKVLPTVTVIRYGTDATSRSSIGQKIDDILSSKKPSTKRPAIQNKIQSKPVAPPKSTHPFFVGKAQKDAPPAKVVTELPPATPRRSAVTPGKLRAETRRDQSPEPPSFYSRGLQTSRGSKQSGLIEASWPTGENTHVRNTGMMDGPPRLNDSASLQLALRPRKLKNAVVNVPEHEDMIARLARDLSQDGDQRSHQSIAEFAPPEDVRLPARLLTTGPEIQRKVYEQLLAKFPPSAATEQSWHVAVRDLFKDIENTLTPFDEGKCEAQSWTQKYAPTSAAHVLQTGADAVVLKDWLESLTVMAVSGVSKSVAAVDAKQPPRKKRKKALDDFIVPDDEEEEEEDMVMLPGAEAGSYMQPSSFRRPQWTRDKNVVLISGSHGCGKSATVHAVAKEMGFEVFEIHAGMRRSGKDIQDKVGDMTGNHLVNHKREAAANQEAVDAVDDTKDHPVDTTIEKDISSGRQGTMTSFFQTKPGVTITKPKVQPKIAQVKKTAPPAAGATLPTGQASRTSQKQSLILIEEADILFEEDQQFWAQVTKMAALSKRPIVITCNDERQIPMHDLPLAAVLRLQSPPVELATDYLLVLAGREGHILERQAVKELYESKDCDLRASIMELDFWCQMSVGDRKGGLEWMYQRWPPGRDVDSSGQTLRVASGGTYELGMGWLSHNVFSTRSNAAFDTEEELLQEIWTGWGISPTDWTAPSDNGFQHMFSMHDPSPGSRMHDLVRLGAYTESLSAVDIFSRVDLPSYPTSHVQPTDATQPAIPEKSRQSYTLAAPLLQIDHATDFLNLSSSLSTQVHLLIQRAYHPNNRTQANPNATNPLLPSPPPLSEAACTTTLLQRSHAKKTNNSLSRPDFSVALDCLAAPPDTLLPERTSFVLTPSSFDRTFSLITLDLAPYVRSIVAHEMRLEAQRCRMSDALYNYYGGGAGAGAEGGGGSGGGGGDGGSIAGATKRIRNTRASRTALEGGVRETKRRERWFDADVDFAAVMRTAGKTWAGMGWTGASGLAEAGPQQTEYERTTLPNGACGIAENAMSGYAQLASGAMRSHYQEPGYRLPGTNDVPSWQGFHHTLGQGQPPRHYDHDHDEEMLDTVSLVGSERDGEFEYED